MKFSLSKPENIHIADDFGNISFGCDQKWFGSFWQRMAGCGTIVASTILLYMHKSKRITLPKDVNCKSDCVTLIDDVWRFVTPTTRGISTIKHFRDGMYKLTQAYGYSIECSSLDIPKKKGLRPPLSSIVDFVSQGLVLDCPIAFLNLSNGKVKNLDEWHWVTIVSLETDKNNENVIAEIYDGEKSIIIDLKLWNETTTLGGGFVYFKEK